MQKAILISIQPQHVLNIITGEKTLELRKSVPKNFEGWVYIYCTKVKPLLGYGYVDEEGYYYELGDRIDHLDTLKYHLNGLVIARFWYQSKCYVHQPIDYSVLNYVFNSPDKEVEKSINLEETCLSIDDVIKYAGNQKRKLYLWEIEKLEVFDKPMEISEFYSFGSQDHHDFITTSKMIDDAERKYFIKSYQVRKAPQSWMYVWVNE